MTLGPDVTTPAEADRIASQLDDAYDAVPARTPERTPREWMSPAFMTLLSMAVGVVGFTYRLLAHRGLPNDQYMHLTWAQQMLMGEWPGRDFVEPGMPLMTVLSAVVQYGWHGPFSEVVLCAAMLGVAAAATSLTITLAARAPVWAVSAGLLGVAMAPRFYSYPKILAPAVGLALLAWHARAPSLRRAAALGAWTSVSALLRYDLGVYVAGGTLIALCAVPPLDRRRRWPIVGTYVAAAAVVIAPWLVLIQLVEGLPEHLRETLEFTKGDAHQLAFAWPELTFGISALHSTSDILAALVYLVYVLPPLTLLVAWIRRRLATDAERATLIGSAVMLALYLALVLRHPLEVRIRDLATPMAVTLAMIAAAMTRGGLTALCTGSLMQRLWPTLRLATATGGAALLAAATWTFGDVAERLEDTRLLASRAKAWESLTLLHEAGSEWPWTRYWPAGPIPEVVRYIDACTAPTDRVFLTWPAAEFYYFSRRGFGGGQAMLAPPDGYTTIRDQEKMLRRLREGDVSLVLINETRRDEMALAYPRLDAYIRDHFRAAGTFQLRDGSDVSIAVPVGTAPRGTYGPSGWPCGLAPTTVTSARAVTSELDAEDRREGRSRPQPQSDAPAGANDGTASSDR